jgi:hypothetical protein
MSNQTPISSLDRIIRMLDRLGITPDNMTDETASTLAALYKAKDKPEVALLLAEAAREDALSAFERASAALQVEEAKVERVRNQMKGKQARA